MSDKARFAVLICDLRPDGTLWPITQLHDLRMTALMEAPAMEVVSGQKSVDICVEPMKRALKTLLAHDSRGKLKAALREVAQMEGGAV
jgi:hypothetical protein